jgi:AbrB family looped-hinge helix DNA binding protein
MEILDEWVYLEKIIYQVYFNSMITTVTQKNMISIPSEIWRKMGIKPGYKLDWQPIEGREEILIKIIPDRAELARRFAGLGAKREPQRDVVAELDSEREMEG